MIAREQDELATKEGKVQVYILPGASDDGTQMQPIKGAGDNGKRQTKPRGSKGNRNKRHPVVAKIKQEVTIRTNNIT